MTSASPATKAGEAPSARAIGDLSEDRRPRRAVDQAQAVEEQGGGEGPDEDVLDAGLDRTATVDGVACEHVEAEAEELEGDVGGEQLARRDHRHHAEDGEEEDAVELAVAVQVPLHVVGRGQDHEGGDGQEEELEEGREAVDVEEAVVEDLGLTNQGDRRAPRGGDAGQRQKGEPVLAIVGQEEVDGDDQEGRARQDELGEEEGEVDVH